MKDFEVVKEQANDLFKAGKYGAARDLYKTCLEHCPEDKSALLSNLAAVHLKLQLWQPALACAETVLKSQPDHFKCLYRAGVANMHLERYHSSVSRLEQALQQSSADATVRRHLAEARDRLQQARGDYDPRRLYFQEGKQHWDDFSSHTNPRLSIKRVAGKGRGLVLTGAVKKGDLLAACRPLAVASKHPIELEEGCCPTTLVMEALTTLQEYLTLLAARDPHVRQQLWALYDGTEESLKQLPRISMFQGPPEGPAQDNVTLQDLVTPEPVEVDGKRLADIIKYNAIITGDPAQNGLSIVDPLLIGGDRSPRHHLRATTAALYPLMSMANHSCCPSACYVVVHGVAFLRAARDLKKGAEVTIAYHERMSDMRTKRQAGVRNWNFTCSCERCLVEAALPSAALEAMHAVMQKLNEPQGIQDAIRAAWDSPDAQAATMPVLKQLKGLLSNLEQQLDKGKLSDTSKAWMKMNCFQAYRALRDCQTIRNAMKTVFQLTLGIGKMYDLTTPGSMDHIIEAVVCIRIFRLRLMGSGMHMNLYLEATNAMVLRYGSSLQTAFGDCLTDAMIRIDTRVAVIQQLQHEGQVTPDMVAYANLSLRPDVNEAVRC